MRSRRLSFVVGWAGVALLAIVGFAAFAAPSSDTAAILAAADEASIGHTAGAYAGLSFALVEGESITAVPLVTEDAETDTDKTTTTEGPATDEQLSSGTIASPSSGWLSEVEVRALVSIYFEPQDVNKAIRIAWCYSRFDPNAVDKRTGGVGLFGHLPQYWEERTANAGFPGAPATDPEASIAAAAWEIYNGAGWAVFNCR